MTLAKHFGTPGCTGPRSGSDYVNYPTMCQLPHAPAEHDRQSAAKGFWQPWLASCYVVGWLVDWLYWAHDSFSGLLFGWLPALLWPVHLASFALFDWLPQLITP